MNKYSFLPFLAAERRTHFRHLKLQLKFSLTVHPENTTALTGYVFPLRSFLSASEADRSSSETEDEEVDAGRRREKERNSGWGGVFFSFECVWVYIALL